MGLLQRYLLRQLIGPFVFSLMALTSIMLLNQVARRFGHLVGKGLDWAVIAEVFALSIPFIVAMTMPMAVLLAVLYTFSHLSADSEITAMRASGISVGQLLTPVVVAGILLSGGTFVFVDQVLPRTNARLRTLLFDIARKKPTLELNEQIVNEIPPSRLFLRSSRIDPNGGRLKDVVIYDLTSQDRPRIIYADSGQMAVAGNQQDLRLRLHQGEVHEFETDDASVFRLTAFQMNTILIRNVSNELERGTTEAVRGDRELSTCEMHDIVRQARRDVAQSRRDRNRFLRNDLRALMELPPPAGLSQDEATPRRTVCDAWEETISLLLPRTAEATEVAQDTVPAKPSLPRPVKPRSDVADMAQDTVTPSKLIRLREARARAREKASAGAQDTLISPRIDRLLDKRAEAAGGTETEVQEEPVVADRHVVLVAWSDISAARDVEKVAQRKANAYLVEIHKKWAISVACLAFVIVGIPMALRFPRGGMGLVIGGGLSVFAIYYVGLTAGEGLGDLGRMAPWIPMWAPNMILMSAGALGLLVVARHTGTARGGDFADLWESFKRFLPQRRAAG